MTFGQLIRNVKPRTLFGVPCLRNDLPYSFVFQQQHHFDATVYLCPILSHFATSSGNGDIAEHMHHCAQRSLEERVECSFRKVLHALHKAFDGLSLCRSCSRIKRSPRSEV